jgi:hypothetical protein
MMNKFISGMTIFILVIAQSYSVSAAEVEVTWTHPEKYSDVDAGEEHRKKFKERTFKSFEKHFAKLAEKLPEQQTLIFDVTNVDLAGDVHYGGIKRIRVIKDIHFPRMKFSYQLVNADKSVAKSAEISLKDMSFLMTSNMKYRNKSLGYEKEMLDDWFNKTFKSEMIQ